MWEVVLLMALASGLGPKRIAAVVLIVSRTKPLRLLLAYCAGGIASTFAVAGTILFAFRYSSLGQSNDLFPWMEIGAGAVALSIALLVGSGLGTRIMRFWHRIRARHRSMSQLSLVDRMPSLLRAKLRNESPWLAALAGIAFGLPTLYMIASIAAVLDGRVEASVQVLALLVFSSLTFIQGIIPLVGFLVAPNTTDAGLRLFYAWLKANQRVAVATVSTLTGSYLLIKGITRL